MVKDSESLSTENERAREVGEKRERGGRIDRKTRRERERQGGGLYNAPVNIVFICIAVDAADYGITCLFLMPF